VVSLSVEWGKAFSHNNSFSRRDEVGNFARQYRPLAASAQEAERSDNIRDGRDSPAMTLEAVLSR
jgi:hypothetical protein